jgi:triose/dihydroxyacetone kinase / FAD-AMP lyase (cyclizing)
LRFLTPNVFKASKILGAASDQGRSFDDVVALGKRVTANLVTMTTSLDHCHVPGRSEFVHLADDEAEIGMGIHNEPGVRKIKPIPEPEIVIGEMLKYLLDPNDGDRAFVRFEDSDEVVLLVNNLGGLSVLELGAITDEVLRQLGKAKGTKISPILGLRDGSFMQGKLIGSVLSASSPGPT